MTNAKMVAPLGLCVETINPENEWNDYQAFCIGELLCPGV